MQVCTSLQTDNHTSTPPLSFLQAACPSCHPTNSVKALKALKEKWYRYVNSWLYLDMFVFYDWPFPHMYFAKNVAYMYFPFYSWLSFQRLCHLLWGYHYHFVDSSCGSNNSVISVPSWHVWL